MRVFRGLDALPRGGLRQPVTTVGVFDGVHRGHRQLLYELGVWAGAVDGERCVVTFDRHPLTVLRGIEVPAILTLETRLLELERNGVDACALLDFAEVKDLPPEAFLERVIARGFGGRHLLLGFDSRLGKDRAGTPETLPAMGAALGIEVRIASPVLDKSGHKIGSSAIRDAIRAGDLDGAANMLGRPYTLRGEVQHGEGRGTELGTATANVDVGDLVLPPDGVYLVRVFQGARTAPAVANLGVKPTFGDGAERTLEVHVPGWSGSLYGRTLEVRLVRRLRAERRFDGAEALQAQIRADLAAFAEAVARGEL